MEKLMKKVHQYRMEHGYPADEEELLKFALYFYIMVQRGGRKYTGS